MIMMNTPNKIPCNGNNTFPIEENALEAIADFMQSSYPVNKEYHSVYLINLEFIRMIDQTYYLPKG